MIHAAGVRCAIERHTATGVDSQPARPAVGRIISSAAWAQPPQPPAGLSPPSPDPLGVALSTAQWAL
eukprot:6524643-Alexandrium_andersonii.AAC.1